MSVIVDVSKHVECEFMFPMTMESLCMVPVFKVGFPLPMHKEDT
jgi:hypothetical protein